MSRSAKKRVKEQRRQKKAQRKASNIARYASFIGTAANKKKKGKAASETAKNKHQHLFGKCGNSACYRCLPSETNNPWLATQDSCLYGKRFTSRKWKNKKVLH